MSREDVRARFARNAANYVTSAFHADSALLDEVVALAVPQPTDVVLKPQGRAVFVDCSPPPAAREVLHRVEILRDPSHVRSYTLEEWKRRLRGAGFRVDLVRRRELDWDFEAWNLRIGVPAARLAELAVPIETAGGRARAALRPERRAGKLWHAYWHAEIRAVKP